MSKIRRKLSLILGLAAASFAGFAMAAKSSPSLMSDADLDNINGAGGGTAGDRRDQHHKHKSRDKKRR